jgi:cytoskeleton protein RodZ
MDESARTRSGSGEAASPGALLRAAREGQGMHIATLAAAIKVAPRKLEALERDRWDELPGPTFTRALAQAVCRALKVDPQPVMELLPPADTSILDSGFGNINEPFSGKGGRDPALLGLLPRGPWLIAAIVLLLAAAGLLWAPAGSLSRLFGGAASKANSGAADAGTATTAPVSVATPAVGPSVARPAAAAAATATMPAATPDTATTAQQSSAAGQAPVPAGALVVSCSARSWIEVVDALGRVLVSRNLEAGESLGIDALAPLQVVVGNAAGTLVSYKGAAVDLAPRARDNVARFELK